ncbi:MAG: hypothetical protein H0Z24_09890 [Thermosipho sp. (in: Bacteria)]|nr:hypothetical protein [Thermosipho sp. (in: thermotogales)]
MKKLLIILSIFTLPIFIFSSDYLTIFKNIGLYIKQIPYNEELTLYLNNDENVIFIENAEFYKVEKVSPIEYWTMCNDKDLQNLSYIPFKIINTNPLTLETNQKIYVFNSQINMWMKTEKNNLNKFLYSKKFVAKNIEGNLIITKPLSWYLYYDLKSNGDFYITYTIKGKYDQPIHVWLIDSYLNEDTFTINRYSENQETTNYLLKTVEQVSGPTIVDETPIIDLGKVQPFNGEFSKVTKLGTIKNFNDIPILNINFYSNSFENKYLDLYRIFDNTENNGLGIPLISGPIRIYIKKEDKEFIKYVSELFKTAKDEEAKIFLGQTWSVISNLYILDIIETKSYIEKTFEINLINNDLSNKDIEIIFNGYNLELLKIDTDLKIVEKNAYSDQITLKVKLNNKGKIIISIRSNKKIY